MTFVFLLMFGLCGGFLWTSSLNAQGEASGQVPSKDSVRLISGLSIPQIDSMISVFEERREPCEALRYELNKADRLEQETEFDQSIVLLKRIALEFPQHCDSSLLLHAYRILSRNYIDVQNYSQVDSLARAVKNSFSSEELLNEHYYGLLLNNAIAHVYSGEIDLSKELFRKISSAGDILGNSPIIEQSLNNLGTIFAETGQIDSAQFYFTEAMDLAQERGDPETVTGLMINIANLNSEERRYNRALSLLDSAKKLAEEQGSIEGLANVEENLAALFSKIKNYKKGFAHLNRYVDLKDSLLSAEKIRAVAEAEQKFESERRKRQIQELQLQNLNSELQKARAERIRNYFIMGGVVLLLAFIGLWWRMQHIRKTRREIEKEKERSDWLLLNILPEEIAEELKRKGTYNARHHERVSIMFADFKDFTQSSEQMSAEELVDEIDYCFKAFDKICTDYSLEKIKTIGDCYMVASGLPVKKEDDVENIVLAALEMQDFIQTRKRTRESRGHIGFDMRIGIHTGPVVAGVVGSDKFSYDIWGDTVNLASRMESSGEVGRVNISQETYELIRDCPEVQFKQRGKVHAKHKGDVDMYFVSRKQVYASPDPTE